MTKEINETFSESEAKTQAGFWWRLVMLWNISRIFAGQIPSSQIDRGDHDGKEELYINRGLRYIQWLLNRAMMPRVAMEGRSGWTKEFISEYRRRMLSIVKPTYTRRENLELPEKPDAIIFGIQFLGKFLWLIADSKADMEKRAADKKIRENNEFIEKERQKHTKPK